MSRRLAALLAPLAILAPGAHAAPTPQGALAAALLCQTSYRLDDELAADEAAGDRSYPPATARLAALLREAFGEAATRDFRLFRSRRLDLLAFGVVVPGMAVVTFRGSRGPQEAGPGQVANWALNRLAAPREDAVGFAPVAVHPGYAHAAAALIPPVDAWLRRRAPGTRVVLTGHSLGAALAGYAVYRLAPRHAGRGALVTFGAPAIAYTGCGRDLGAAFAARAPGWEATTYAFEDDAAPWLLRAVCPGATRLGVPVDLGPSPSARPPVGPTDIAPGDPERAASVRLGAAAARWMHLDTHYAFHYVRELARRWAEAEGHAFDPARFREFYGLPRPIPLAVP